MRNVSEKVEEKIKKTHFVFNYVSRKSCRLRDNLETL